MHEQNSSADLSLAHHRYSPLSIHPSIHASIHSTH